MLRIFGFTIAVTIVALIATTILGGPEALAIVVILAVLEVSLSFDNAVVNATVLVRMSLFWQKIFLTVGVLIAVFGMRLVFPIILVSLTAKIGPIDAVNLALDGGSVDTPGTYASLLDEAHPAIAAFGGMFLFMLFLDFLFEEREITWLSWLERPLARIGKLDQLSAIVALITLLLAARIFAGDRAETVLLSGVLGVITYIAVNGLGELFEGAGDHDGDDLADDSEDGTGKAVDRGPNGVVLATGKAAFFLFLYLEVLDASFSFDGVVGAFAISQDLFIIATGLGIGAFYVRSITIYLVRKGTLSEYVYLEHGAHWAIGALAGILLVSIEYHVPELITGLVGVGFIGAALISSIIARRRNPALAIQAHVG
ncbi:MAG: hypothetical protein JWN61_2125 [Pseudonocardiales bacterium]|nr:hypothetical protein [Pseudonocardiales bacterium]